MKKPIEILLDQVDWQNIPPDESIRTFESGEEVPTATHQGVLKIGEFQFKVYQLSDGRRVIDEKDIKEFCETLQDTLKVAKLFNWQ